MTRIRLLLALGVLLVLGLGARVVRDSGMLMEVQPHFAGRCEAVPGVTGGEDITIDHAWQQAFVSSDDRRAHQAGQPVPGRIFRLDMADPAAKPQDITPTLAFSFHPHGFSLYRDAQGGRRLFVVNHREDGSEAVEIFRVPQQGPLVHLRSVTYPALISPNDLVATGPEQFYATSDHGFARGHWLQRVEDYLGLPLASVSYFDGQQGTQVAGGLRYANGINASADGRTLYVAEVTARRLQEFTVGSSPVDVHKERQVFMGTGIDNLEWGDDGYLWTAGHPKLFAFMVHAKNAQAPSPSHVIRIDPKTLQPTDVMLNDGRDLSASSVAAVHKGTMLVGPVYAPYLLRCRL